ncbi:MFS transporter [Nigerium massiliense]|uniref:MFS transporter n=1 Tax=Nigerium massiliense TaxID=1522317 RepID=UPI000ABB39B2|nr:MFS transporter [Nigerium massiliense]
MNRLHPAWPVAIVTAAALLSASAFRSTTGVLMPPIMVSTCRSMATVSGAASLNLVLYGLATPFTAALMQTLGVRRTVVLSLGVVAAASAATVAMTAPWQLWLLWGVLLGLGTGAMALTFGAIVANRWFVAHRNVVTGVFSAATAAGQVLFVPIVAAIADGPGWQTAALVTSACALATGVACLLWLRDRPSDVGATPLGAGPDDPGEDEPSGEPPLRATLRVLLEGSRRWPFWALMLTFFVCGWSTNGLIVVHLMPAGHDHSMPATLTASLIGIIGVFDIVGAVASGWLTRQHRPTPPARRVLQHARTLPAARQRAAGPDPRPAVVGLGGLLRVGLDGDRPAHRRPHPAGVRHRRFGVAFGWIYAAHMVGAGVGANVSGLLRDHQGTYDAAWLLGAALCLVAGGVALTIRRPRTPAAAELTVLSS